MLNLLNMVWCKKTITTEKGELVEAQSPLIISASRSTDIPAFYADWFFYRLEKGYSAWTNPFNGVRSYVSYTDTRFIVFWSKNPKPLLKYLDHLAKKNIGCYIQYTLNDYVDEHLEAAVPSVDERIETFRNLVDKLGFGHVIWRFDPLILTDKISIDTLLNRIEYIGDRLKGYTEKLVFSFVDIALYKKVQSNLKKCGCNYTEWTKELMEEFASRLSELNKKWGYQLATCGEKIDIDKYGILHNRCVDDELMMKVAPEDSVLMEHLGVSLFEPGLFDEIPEGAIDLGNGRYAIKKKGVKDKGQRAFCGCIASKDIGEYNTCAHQCEYCYANASKEMAISNLKRHRSNPFGETITGK